MNQDDIGKILCKVISQGGDPIGAVMLRYALEQAPPPLVQRILSHPDVRVEVDRTTQRLLARDNLGNELCTAGLDVDARSHALRHVLEQYEAGGGKESDALAKWALNSVQGTSLDLLQLIGMGLLEVRVAGADVMVRSTEAGRVAAEGRLEEANAFPQPNDPCPCGSGRKFKRWCRHRNPKR